MDVNMEAVAKINNELLGIRKELKDFDVSQQIPNPFNPLIDSIPAEIDEKFDVAIEAVRNSDEEAY